MGWFDRAVQRGVTKALGDFCAPAGPLHEIVERTVWKQMDESLSRTARLTPLGFTWALRLCFRKHGCSFAQASDLANSTLRQYLTDEKIKFGATDYSWTRGAAEEIADEYELQHWEGA